MKLSEELKYRGLIYQTTYKNLAALDNKNVTFYFGVDPSSDSMTIGNLAAIMLVKLFLKHGHKGVLLVGGATGMIGDPDGKKSARPKISPKIIKNYKEGIKAEYERLLKDKDFTLVDNYDWFKKIKYIDFLNEIGRHVPLRTMLSRDFVQSRINTEDEGLSYAEFSYSLIQAYDFYFLNQYFDVTLQLCGADQWGNSIAGVDLIRRKSSHEVNVLSLPLIVNKSTGIKFGKSEIGAIWLNENKTSVTKFYQFWINLADQHIEDYLKIYTTLPKREIDQIMTNHQAEPSQRIAQHILAKEVTTLVHGEDKTLAAIKVSQFLTGERSLSEINKDDLDLISQEIPVIKLMENLSIANILVEAGLASSLTEGRQLLKDQAIRINNKKVNKNNFESGDFEGQYLILRKGKAFKDSALIKI